MVNYENLQSNIVEFLRLNSAWSRAISIDIEADLKTLDDPTKHILNISVARRIDDKIKINNFIANSDSIESEIEIFNKLGDFCQEVRPLVLIGYGISRFDLPILLLKMRQLDDSFKKDNMYQPGYWAFRDALTRSYVLDAINPVRFEIAQHDNSKPKFVKLEFALSHDRFKHLPFKNNKSIVSKLEGDKWDIIYNLWKNNRKKFIDYVEGDVHDTLLLVEDIFKLGI